VSFATSNSLHREHVLAKSLCNDSCR
jgi:hypothetical protein